MKSHMTVEQGVLIFGTKTLLAEVLGVTHSAVSQWETKRDGIIPELRVIKLFNLTPYVSVLVDDLILREQKKAPASQDSTTKS